MTVYGCVFSIHVNTIYGGEMTKVRKGVLLSGTIGPVDANMGNHHGRPNIYQTGPIRMENSM